jgi:hypothetical protein
MIEIGLRFEKEIFDRSIDKVYITLSSGVLMLMLQGCLQAFCRGEATAIARETESEPGFSST